MRKRYEVVGMMEWHPEFRIGRTRIVVSFTGGHLGAGACTPASCEVTDKVLQTVIENSQAFRSGRIRIGNQWDMPEDIAETETSKPVGEEMEFEDFGLAADFLHYSKGVALERLADEDSIMEEGRKVGIKIKITKK